MTTYAHYASHIRSPLGPRTFYSNDLSPPTMKKLLSPFPPYSSSMASSRPRVGIKDSSQHIWRDRFKQQCLDRIKESREIVVSSRRTGLGVVPGNRQARDDEDEWIGEIIAREWKNFKEQNELAYLHHVGTINADIADLMEYDLLRGIREDSMNVYNPALDEYIALEEAEIGSAIEAFQDQELAQMQPTFSDADIASMTCFRCGQSNFTAKYDNQKPHHAVAYTACGCEL